MLGKDVEMEPVITASRGQIELPCQQGVDGDKAKTGISSWNWARLLGGVPWAAVAHSGLHLPPWD